MDHCNTYLKLFLDLHEHMLEEKLYEKQNLIKERHIRKLYRQGIHGRPGPICNGSFRIPDVDFYTWASIKTNACHIGAKTESVLLVMPPTQLRLRLDKEQIKRCRMGILLGNIYLRI